MFNGSMAPENAATLYVSDLDGTLLNRQARLSSFSRQHLTYMLSEGMRFTVATARSAPAVQALLCGIVLPLPIIEQNGACLTDLTTGRRVAVQALSEQSAAEVMRLFRSQGAEVIVSCISAEGDRLWFEAPQHDGTRWYVNEKRLLDDPRLREVSCLGSCVRGQVLSLTTLVPEATALELAASLKLAFGAKIQVRAAAHGYAAPYWELSVLSGAATKANAIRALRDALHLDPCGVVVFGDAENDLDMFHAADVRVAVGNAVPEILSLAHHVTESNKEDGVVRWLLKRLEMTELL
jgi:Cof subfamily protein (haloacid dehalogenase superfamily)